MIGGSGTDSAAAAAGALNACATVTGASTGLVRYAQETVGHHYLQTAYGAFASGGGYGVAR